MDTETVRVTWTTDVEVKLGTLDRDIAQSVAEGYFQPRIANGEPDSACVFKVDGREVDLSTPRTLQLDLAEASERVLAEFQSIEDSGDRGDFGIYKLSSVIALNSLIAKAQEGS